MKRTKQELIDIIKDKQENARQMFENLLYTNNATEKTNELQRANLVGEQKMALDIVFLLESTEIVPDNTTIALIPEIKQEDLKMFEKIPITTLCSKSLCDTCNASRDKYGLCMWIKGTGIKASQCGHYCNPKDTLKAEALGVSEPTCEKSANVEVKEEQKVICDTCKNYATCKAMYKGQRSECGYYIKEAQKPQEIRNDQFREFEYMAFSGEMEIYFISAKQVGALGLSKCNNKYYIYIYTPQMFELVFDTKEEQEQSYNELKEWVQRWNS